MKTLIGKCKDNFFVLLPKEAIDQLNWGHGDLIEVQIGEDSVTLARKITQHGRAMEIARRGMEKYREVFEAFAKT